MANGNYTYNPAEIKDKTVSRMRFELEIMEESKTHVAGKSVPQILL